MFYAQSNSKADPLPREKKLRRLFIRRTSFYFVLYYIYTYFILVYMPPRSLVVHVFAGSDAIKPYPAVQ